MKMIQCSAGWPRSHHTTIEIKVDLYVHAMCHVHNMAHGMNLQILTIATYQL